MSRFQRGSPALPAFGVGGGGGGDVCISGMTQPNDGAVSATVGDATFCDDLTLGADEHLPSAFDESVVLVGDVEGVLDRTDGSGTVISTVSHRELAGLERGISDVTSHGGTGGMKSKVHAARAVIEHGTVAVIARGKTSHILERIMSGAPVGTLFS